MLLSLFTLDHGKYKKNSDRFLTVLGKRYPDRLAGGMGTLDDRRFYLGVKPFHAGVIPYVLLDFAVQARGIPCHAVFANDILDYRGDETLEQLTPEKIESLLPSLEAHPGRKLTAEFRGFGPRIDLALNTIARLYLDVLFTLTRVEAEVLDQLRELQFDRYGDPTQGRTFGLQKHVAERLGKTPVAVHKSLKSAKYELISDTAKAMQSIIG